MHPLIEGCPDFPFEKLTDKHLVYDLIYNPERTIFLNQAAARNAHVKNGLEMLYLQAERAWEIWNQDAL
jgi:shikimate dehydrogenase